MGTGGLRERDLLMQSARWALDDIPLLRERAEGDLLCDCTRNVCYEPEVRELAAIVLALLDERTDAS
jgi:hypothetical protein